MIRVILADDEGIVLEGIRILLERTDDIEVVGVAGNGREALRGVQDLRPDVLLLDLDMPELDGFGVLARLRHETPRPRVVVLTTFGAEEDLARAWEAGADGFLLKASSLSDLVYSVRRVHEKGNVVSPALVTLLMNRLAQTVTREEQPLRKRIDTLSPNERLTAGAVARGATNAEIAGKLGVAEGTVKAYVSRSLRKLGFSNRTQLAIALSAYLEDFEEEDAV
ncbi:response regulator transcription factor [Streptomyces sp. 135]|uniref:response regulator n=1 Tax=Streptomyces sp. 135 TaxID=2838850 RepID=UPI001CBFEB5C|nr:response regulator transcription factor [Streptomyces sp. 135]